MKKKDSSHTRTHARTMGKKRKTRTRTRTPFKDLQEELAQLEPLSDGRKNSDESDDENSSSRCVP